MAIFNKDDLLRGGMDRAVELMTVSANTALTFGKKKLVMVAFGPEEFDDLGGFCEGVAGVSPLAERDGMSFIDLAKEDARGLLIGAGRKSAYNYDCGACGFATCAELNKADLVEGLVANGPCCHFAVYDVHMAAMAASAAAWRMGLHCRVFQTMGTAAMACEIITDVDFCVGVGVSYQQTDPYFDRHKFWTEEEWLKRFERDFPSFVRRFIGAVE
jgi:uncharacterized ferredoxin-like protein